MKNIPLLLSFSLIISIFSLIALFFKVNFTAISFSLFPHNPNTHIHPLFKIYVADLPRSFNYGLLDKYWSLSSPDSRINADPDAELRSSIDITHHRVALPYPENPLIKQYSAEYWLLGDLETQARSGPLVSVIERVYDWKDSDVVFVPFFATLSAEIELGWGRKGGFLKKEGNEDYRRQRDVVDWIRSSGAWKRSGGRDHVFVLTDPVAMWHVRAEIAPAMLLVVDFGGWYKFDTKASHDNTSHVIQHTKVSLLKDVIVPYTHLLPRLHLLEDQPRNILLYFKGAKHRHRGGLVREKLWDVLLHEHGVVMEEGFPNATGREQSLKGMRGSEFCLHPAGDTPTSCRLFDAILSLCIPVIVSDDVELPFEGLLDYSGFTVSVSVDSALQPGRLVAYLRSFSKEQKDGFRRSLASVQHVFEFDNGSPGGMGPVPFDGAVNNIWRKVHQKLPFIKEAIAREKRKPEGGISAPHRCHCM